MQYNNHYIDAGWRSGLSRKPHKLEIGGSNPSPATIYSVLLS